MEATSSRATEGSKNAVKISWAKYGELLDELIRKIGVNRYDVVIGIAKGGLPIAVTIANKFDITMQSITIRSYSGRNKVQNPRVQPSLSNLDIQGKRVILVDDICDTGDTVIAALDWIKNFDPSEVTVAALFVKLSSKYIPVVYVETSDQWVVFPYEADEGESIPSKR